MVSLEARKVSTTLKDLQRLEDSMREVRKHIVFLRRAPENCIDARNLLDYAGQSRRQSMGFQLSMQALVAEGQMLSRGVPHSSPLQGQLVNIRSFANRLPLELNELCAELDQLATVTNKRMNDPRRSGGDGATHLPVNELWGALGNFLDLLDRSVRACKR
jgi:hypothetical protein